MNINSTNKKLKPVIATYQTAEAAATSAQVDALGFESALLHVAGEGSLASGETVDIKIEHASSDTSGGATSFVTLASTVAATNPIATGDSGGNANQKFNAYYAIPQTDYYRYNAIKTTFVTSSGSDNIKATVNYILCDPKTSDVVLTNDLTS